MQTNHRHQYSDFYRPDALPAANQQCQSTEDININHHNKKNKIINNTVL